jgi:plasmid stabilization system protein ParE
LQTAGPASPKYLKTSAPFRAQFQLNKMSTNFRALIARTEKANFMIRGSKSSYTDKQKRQAEHIEEGYEKRGVRPKTAKARAWATVNRISGGGKKSGSGRGKKPNNTPTMRRRSTTKRTRKRS